MEHLSEVELDEVTGGVKIPYIMKQGETIQEVAQRFRCTVADICNWNNSDNFKFIEPGDLIIIKF